jgi:3-dehydroquinate synthase
MQAREEATAMPDCGVIRVAMTAAAEAYDVHVGADVLDRLPAMLRQAAPAFRYAVISDDHVAHLYGSELIRCLREDSLTVDLFTFPSGEANKTRETWSALTDAILGAGVGRDACIIGLGGGVTGDVAGFVAATYMRGIPVVHVPTSLLAMLDASVGGKTGVDVDAGKNLVGAFIQPRVVLADTTVLRTLSDSDFRAGLAEAVKHGFIADLRHLEWIERHGRDILERDPGHLVELVRTSVAIKAAIVTEDPFEIGRRATLNFGHTIGHALERVSRYSIPHGYAVAAGMVVECRIGEILGVSAPDTASRLLAVLYSLGIPVMLPDVVDDVVEATRSDKKGRASSVRYALVARPGQGARTGAGGWTFEVQPEVVRTALRAALVALSQENTGV